MTSTYLHHNTPLLLSKTLGPQEVLLKMEALQPGGSFKLRGVGLLCEEAAKAGAKSFVIPSGGNAGIATTIAGVALGIPVTVVTPKTTSEEAKNALKSLGATVKVSGASFEEASVTAQQIVEETSGRFIHPFDDPLLWKGHASLIDEVVETGEAFDCVVTAVGGGGLMLGLLEGLDRNGLSDCPVFGVETFGADSLAKSVVAKERVTLPAITSIATSLGAKQVAEGAFDAAMAGRVTPLTVSDEDAVNGICRLLDDQRVLVEPACGAVIAALEKHADALSKFKRPLVVVCGGAGISLARLEQLKAS